ncbi:MAG: type II secretion system F family protein [Nanoarchaeota archaeon]
MKFKIPFTAGNLDKLKKRSKYFASKIEYKKNSKLGTHLKNSGLDLTREEYMGICLRNSVIAFVFLFILSTTILYFFNIKQFYFLSLGISIIFALFILFSQSAYPRVYVLRRQRDIERNLISALEDISVQLSSGIPLFTILSNVAGEDYGELSVEFKKAVRRINSGESETDVLDDLGKKNPSVFFRRALWQISNGMRAGSDMNAVIKDSIKALNEEQMIQIQTYGNKLNPLMVFYMLVSVIVPALSIAFLTIIASMITIPGSMVNLMFIGLFVLVFLIQIMFLGMIKSRRPSLL